MPEAAETPEDALAGGDLARPRAPLGVRAAEHHLPALRWHHFLLFAVVYLYAFPYFDKLRSAQEMPRLLLTQEIIEHRSFRLENRFSDMGSRNDLSIGPDGHYYANKSPGPSFVGLLPYGLARILVKPSVPVAMWIVRVGAITLPALLFLPFFYRWTRRFTTDENARRAALAGYALASPAVPYSMLLYSHMLAAVCLGGAFALAVHLTRGSPRHPGVVAVLAGVLAGMAPAMDYQAALAAPLVGVYVLFRGRPRLGRAALFAAGAVPPLLGLLAYHKVCFGSPFRISYGLGVDTAPQRGLLGFIGPNAASFHATLFVPSNGLIVLSPWVVLAVVGALAIVLDRRRRLRVGPEALLAAGIVAVYVLFVGSMLPYMARGGWSAGARQLVAVLPFIGWLSAVGFELAGRFLVTRVLATAAVLFGAVVFFGAATTYPHWPDQLRNPLFELSFPLLRAGYAVHSLGTLVGLRGFASIAPLYLFALVLCAYLLVRGIRRRAIVLALSAVLALGVLAVHSRPRTPGPYAGHVWSWVTATWEPGR